jgi:lipopolysaccharide export system permease protein
MQYVWLQIDELVGKGLTWNTILEFLGWFAIFNIPMSLPLSTLLASLMTLGNLGENNELLALKSSGISLHKILYPLYFTIFLVAVGSYFLSSEFVPYAYLRARTMLMEIKKKSPELSIPEDIFYDGIERFGIRVTRKDPVTGALIGVMIYDHTTGEGNYSVTIADTGYIKQTQDARYILLKLVNGINYSESLNKNNQLDKKTYPFNRRIFKEQTVSIDMGVEEAQSFEFLYKDQPLAKSMTKLNKDSDSIIIKRQDLINKFDNEQLNSTSAFKYTLKKDTVRQRVKNLTYNIDSMFINASALKKVSYLEQAESNVKRITTYWENEIRIIQLETKNLKNINYERNRKFTLAFTCLIFFFIGAPLGAIIRKGGLGLPAVISIFFFVVYWVIDTICRKMVTNGEWSPFFGAWFPSLVLAPIAIFLTYKANTDSQLFNPDAYKRFFNILFGQMKKLMEPIDLDKIIPLANDRIDKAKQESPINAKQLDLLIDNYLKTHQLSKMFQSRQSILKINDNQDLWEIKSLYDYILGFYVTIDDDENVRNIIKGFSELNPEEFTFPQFLLNQNQVLKIPYTLILIIMKIRKFKKLEYILENIKSINIDVNDYLNGRNKY